MPFDLFLFLGFGILITWAGWKITFTNEGFEWMYKNKIWTKESNVLDDVSRVIFDKIRGGGILAVGIIFSVFAFMELLKYFSSEI